MHACRLQESGIDYGSDVVDNLNAIKAANPIDYSLDDQSKNGEHTHTYSHARASRTNTNYVRAQQQRSLDPATVIGMTHSQQFLLTSVSLCDT